MRWVFPAARKSFCSNLRTHGDDDKTDPFLRVGFFMFSTKAKACKTESAERLNKLIYQLFAKYGA